MPGDLGRSVASRQTDGLAAVGIQGHLPGGVLLKPSKNGIDSKKGVSLQYYLRQPNGCLRKKDFK
jgi:invasion protein IalB